MLTKCPRAFCIHSPVSSLRPHAAPRRASSLIAIAIAISYFLPRFWPCAAPLAQAQPCRAPSPETALSSPPFWYPSRPLYHLLTQLRLLLLGSLWYKRTPSACCLLCCCCGTGIGSLHSVLLQLMKGNLVLGRDSMVSRIVRLGLGVIAFGNGVH